MSGSISFRFKKPINWAYAPGLTKAGEDGSIGNPGCDGNAIYFIDYELNNSYNIELAQQKLENNFTLSGNSVQISEDREYHSGDIIISDKGNCYRIEKSEKSYYTFDIKYIGKISTTNNDSKIDIAYLLICKSENDNHYNNFIPNNRQVLSTIDNNRYSVKNRVDSNILTDNATQEEVFRVDGIWYKFLVITNNSPEYFKYSVEVNLKNEKTYNFDSEVRPDYNSFLDPTTNTDLYRCFNFNKPLEFPAAAMTYEQYINGDYVFNDFLNWGGIEPSFISDMSMDKSHLFGNDVKHLVARKNGELYCSTDGYSIMDAVPSSNTILQTHATIGHSWPDNSNHPLVPAVYSAFNTGDVAHSSSESLINWRGGESAYFSSYPQNSVVSAIHEFIKGAEFKITAHNINTGEIKYINNVSVIWIES